MIIRRLVLDTPGESCTDVLMIMADGGNDSEEGPAPGAR